MEEKKLEMLEEIISRGLQNMLDTAEALCQIQEEELYRIGFDSWQEYCQARWGIRAEHAKRLVRHVNVIYAGM